MGGVLGQLHDNPSSGMLSVEQEKWSEIKYKVCRHKFGKKEKLYWIQRGLQTLHEVNDVKQAEILLTQINGDDRLYYLTCRDTLRRTPLHTAAWNDSLAIANLIIRSVDSDDRDSIIYCVDNDSMTPLNLTKSVEIADFLLSILSQNLLTQFMKHADRMGQTPLHRAAQSNRMDLAELMLGKIESHSRDLIICCVDQDGESPLHQTVSLNMTKLLLSNLSPSVCQQLIRLQDRWGRTAAHRASINGHYDVLKEIWHQSNDITHRHLLSCRDVRGDSLLMEAGWNGNREAVKLLLNLIADWESDWYLETVIAGSHDGDTLLHYLIVHQLVDEVVEVMKNLTLERRRNILAIENSRGFSPYQLSMIDPHQIKSSGSFQANEYVNILVFQQFPVNQKLLNVLHLFVNEYNIVSPASIIRCRQTTHFHISHLHLNTQTSAVKVSLSIYFASDILRVCMGCVYISLGCDVWSTCWLETIHPVM